MKRIYGRPDNYFSRLLFTHLLGIAMLGTAFAGHFATAEVYKSVDEQGKVIFTDQPTPEAEPVEVREPNTTPAVKVQPRQNATNEDNINAYTVTITSPSDEQLFPNRLTPFTVSAQVSPPLQENHRLRLTIDGEVHSISTGHFQVNQLALGEHILVVEVIAASNTVLAQSAPVKIFARQPGVN